MKNILSVILLTSILFNISCKKIVNGINENPNDPTDADALTMLPGVETANMLFQGGDVARTASTWSGYCTGELLQSAQIQNYNVGAKDFGDSWFLVYAGVVKNTRIMREKARKINNLGLVGLSQLLEAHAIGTAADLWGDIPFSQAFDDAYENPQYDSQEEVYKGVQSLLDSAIGNFTIATNTSSNSGMGAQELFFNGKLASFIPVAYTLKARNFLHTKKYDLALENALKGIQSRAGNLMARYPGTTKGNTNPWNQYVSIDRLGSLDGKGAYVVRLLNPVGDLYRGNSKTNEAARFTYYYTGATPDLNSSAGAFFGAATSFPLVTYAENLLIIAECEARLNGFAAGLQALNDYRSYLNAGGDIPDPFLSAGTFKYDPYAEDDFEAGGMMNPGTSALDTEEALLKNMIEERYICFIGQIEGFNDLRRLRDETNINVGLPPNQGNKIPQRFLYPQQEINGNTSVPSPIPDLFSPTAVNH